MKIAFVFVPTNQTPDREGQLGKERAEEKVWWVGWVRGGKEAEWGKPYRRRIVLYKKFALSKRNMPLLLLLLLLLTLWYCVASLCTVRLHYVSVRACVCVFVS